MLPGPSQQFWAFPRVGQGVTSPSKLPMVTGCGLKPCRALGFGWKCPVLTQGIGCSRIIPEPRARLTPDCRRRRSEQTLEIVRDLESAGWTHGLHGSFPGLLPTQPAHPSHGCSLFSLDIAPGSAAFHGLAQFRGLGQRQQLPLVGFVWLFVLETSQNFPGKWVFYCCVSPSRNAEYSLVPQTWKFYGKVPTSIKFHLVGGWAFYSFATFVFFNWFYFPQSGIRNNSFRHGKGRSFGFTCPGPLERFGGLHGATQVLSWQGESPQNLKFGEKIQTEASSI